MPTYRFRLIAVDGVIRSPGVNDAVSDAAAFQAAGELLMESDFPVIEVWRSGQMLRRLSKTSENISSVNPMHL